MISNLPVIKELLATKKQAFEELMTKDGCLCIEGVFALAWGGAIDENRGGILLGRTLRFYDLEPEDYRGKGVPKSIPVRTTRKLSNLTDEQIGALSRFNRSTFLSWLTLNDTIRLTFPQFSELLDLINSESMEAQ